MINIMALKAKSEELKIPFSHVFSGFVMECVLSMGTEEAYKKELWLCNEEDFRLDVYKNKDVRQISYQYCGEESFTVFLEKYSKTLTEHLKQNGLCIKQMDCDRLDNRAVLQIQGEMEDRYIPFSVKLYAVDRSVGFPIQKKIHLFMENNKTVDVYLSPVEEVLAEHLAQIMKHLELLNEMEKYLSVYEILRKYPVEGRKMKNALEKICDDRHIPKSQEAFLLWKTYKKYTYMKKKWKVVLRKEKRKDPDWEEMFSLVEQFLEPIWSAICREEIFFSDWMPEIARFLD